MGWELGLNRTVSRLIPTFLRKSRMFHWIASLVFPLNAVNKQFIAFAEEKIVDAQMSSQTQLIEHHLNKLYSPYFPNPTTDRIAIKHGAEEAQAVFNFEEIVDDNTDNPPYISGNMVLYSQNEDVSISMTFGGGYDIHIPNNQYLSSISQLSFRVSGSWTMPSPTQSPYILRIDSADHTSTVAVYLYLGELRCVAYHLTNGTVEQVLKIGLVQQDLNNMTLVLRDSDFHLNGEYIATLSQSISDILVDIDKTGELEIYGDSQIVVDGLTINDEVFEFNEGVGDVVNGSKGTVGGIIYLGNVDDMWIDTKDAGKSSPFVFSDSEDFGTLPEDFRLILPSSIQGDEAYVRPIEATLNKYVIDTHKYDTVYA